MPEKIADRKLYDLTSSYYQTPNKRPEKLGISFLETNSSNNSMHIEKIQSDMLASQDSPISSDHIQNTSLRFLEVQIAQHEAEIIKLQDKVYQLNRIIGMSRR